MVNPRVEDFIEVIKEEGQELDLAEIVVSETAPYCDKTLAETDFSAQRLMVVAIRRANGELLLPPKSSAKVEAGDILMLLGQQAAVEALIEQA